MNEEQCSNGGRDSHKEGAQVQGHRKWKAYSSTIALLVAGYIALLVEVNSRPRSSTRSPTRAPC